jgi:predicted nucleotidyltransferase
VTVTAKQTAETLCRRSAEARARAEGHALALRDRVIETVKARLPRGARAWLIGSLASGDFGERSDVDLVLDGVDSQLATSIEIAVCHAAQAEVDLLTYEWLSPSFRIRVEREGIAIHGQ